MAGKSSDPSASSCLTLARRAAVGLAGSALLLAHEAAAKPSAECVRAANEAQSLRDGGHLLAARAELAICARAECPKVVADECRKWLEDVSARIPSAIVVLRDPDGADLAARVLIDGSASPDATAGRSVSLDPGPHTFRAESERGSVARSVLVREREVGQRVVLDLPRSVLAHPLSPTAPARPGVVLEPHRPVPVVTWVLAGTTVVALGVGSVFAVDASTRFADLKSRCPECTADEVSSLRTRSTIADVAFGVAIVVAGVTVLTYLLRPTIMTQRPTSTLVAF